MNINHIDSKQSISNNNISVDKKEELVNPISDTSVDDRSYGFESKGSSYYNVSADD